MRQALLFVLALTLACPPASAAASLDEAGLQTPAAGPGTGLRYEERFLAEDEWVKTTRIVTVDEPEEALDARGLAQEAVPVTVQRRAGDEVLAAERCWADADEVWAVQREPLTDTRLRSPLERAWSLSPDTLPGVFDRLPETWPVANTSVLYEPIPCPARGPATTLDLEEPDSVPLEPLLPRGLGLPDDARLDGEMSLEEARFHEHPARWTNASFTAILPGPLPAPGPGSQSGPLIVQGETANLWVEGLPGPARQVVDLRVRAPNASFDDHRLAWHVELTGHEPRQTTQLDPAPSWPQTGGSNVWTDRGPDTGSYDVAFPLAKALAALEEQAPRYRVYQLQHPDAFVRSAAYEHGASPPPLEETPGPGEVRAPAWSVELIAPAGEGYRGTVLDTGSGSGTDPFGSNSSSQTHVWEAPSQLTPTMEQAGPASEQVGPLVSAEQIRQRLDRLGFPGGSLDRLALELHVPEVAGGAQVTVELAVRHHAPTGATSERARALVDGESGHVLALSDPAREQGSLPLPDAVPSTFLDRTTSEETTGPSLPEGPADGLELAAGAGVLWLLVLGLKTLLSPLFSRIPRDEVLEDPTRRELWEAIREDPGVHLAALIERAGVGNGATRHHLEKLADADLVRRVRHGGYVRFFPAGEFTDAEARREATLRAGSNREVYEAYRQQPEGSIRELARRLDMSSSAVHRALRMLREADVIEE